MADDRIIIKCKECGGWKTLAKHYAGSGPQTDADIRGWINKHAECHPDFHEVKLSTSNFELLTDSDDYDSAGQED